MDRTRNITYNCRPQEVEKEGGMGWGGVGGVNAPGSMREEVLQVREGYEGFRRQCRGPCLEHKVAQSA